MVVQAIYAQGVRLDIMRRLLNALNFRVMKIVIFVRHQLFAAGVKKTIFYRVIKKNAIVIYCYKQII